MGIFSDVISGKGNIRTFDHSGVIIKDIAPQVECMDGTKLSVQASHFHYSTPRDNSGPYIEVEVGFPTVEPPESWASHFDGDWDNDNRTDSVYAYVPIKLVQEYIEAHGGEKE